MLLSLISACDERGTDFSDVNTELATIDPIYPYQWHLQNSGQTAFSSNAGTSGADINMQSTASAGYKGKGVKIAVVDTGLEIAHEDLAANVLTGESWNFLDNTTDPTAPASVLNGDHGTSVAGLIAARDENGVGGRGVAPHASLVGYNFLVPSSTQSTSDFITSLGGSTSQPNSSDVEIFNQSFGTVTITDTSIDSLVEAQLKQGATSLRDGKGAIYVKSAGNGFDDIASLGIDECKLANTYGLSCQNANMDPENTTPWSLVLGALNANGVKASYSTTGSALWVSSPGGEYGKDENLLFGGGYSWNCSALTGLCEPAMVTTDQSGCTLGYSRTSYLASLNGSTFNAPPNTFENNANGLNSNCNYTSNFNGTSSAAPVASGAIALLLEANPLLTARDIKYILAKTSEKVDANHSGTTVTLGDGSYTAELPWTTNAAAYSFHNWYGFGAIDVDAAITEARSYTSTQTALQECAWRSSDNISVAIPDYSTAGVTHGISVTDVLSFVEAVQIKVSATHAYIGDLGIELTSPSGTKSILLNIANGFVDTDLNSMVLLSNAFYGEQSSGTWTIKLIDGTSGIAGTLVEWQIRVYGQGSCGA